MTTNVVDTASSMLASDSRWTFPVKTLGGTSDHALIYVDEGGFDPLVKEALKKVASGSVSATAPAGHDPIVWTDADLARLDTALQDCFGEKKK